MNDSTEAAGEVPGKSGALASCIAASNQTPYFNTYQTNPHFTELYHNQLVWAYAISF